MQINFSGHISNNVASISKMLNNRAQQANATADTAQNTYVKEMLKAAEKAKEAEKAREEKQAKEADESSEFASLKPSPQAKLVGQQITKEGVTFYLDWAHKHAEVFAYYENLLRDDTYQGELREEMQKHMDFHRDRAISYAGLAGNEASKLVGLFYRDEIAQRLHSGEDFSYEDSRAYELERWDSVGYGSLLDAWNLTGTWDLYKNNVRNENPSSASEVMAALEKAASSLGITLTKHSVFDIEKFDYEWSGAVFAEDNMRNGFIYTESRAMDFNSFGEYISGAENTSLDLNKLANGLYSAEELYAHIQEMSKISKEIPKYTGPVIQDVYTSYDPSKYNGLLYTEGVMLESFFNAWA